MKIRKTLSILAVSLVAFLLLIVLLAVAYEKYWGADGFTMPVLFGNDAPAVDAEQTAATEATITKLVPKCATPTVKHDPACWLKVDNLDNCYIWNPAPQSDSKYTWSGKCRAGVAVGRGSGAWTWATGASSEVGTYANGKKHAQWEIRLADGAAEPAFFEHGVRIAATAREAEDARAQQAAAAEEAEAAKTQQAATAEKAEKAKQAKAQRDAAAKAAVAKLTPKCATPTVINDPACWLKVANRDY